MLFDAFVVWTAIMLVFLKIAIFRILMSFWGCPHLPSTKTFFRYPMKAIYITRNVGLSSLCIPYIFLVYIFNHFSVLSTCVLLNNLFSLTAVIHQVSVQQFTPSLNLMLSSECYASVVVQLKFNGFILCCWWTLVPAKPANLFGNNLC